MKRLKKYLLLGLLLLTALSVYVSVRGVRAQNKVKTLISAE